MYIFIEGRFFLSKGVKQGKHIIVVFQSIGFFCGSIGAYPVPDFKLSNYFTISYESGFLNRLEPTTKFSATTIIYR